MIGRERLSGLVWRAALCVVLLAMVGYAAALFGEFVFDDVHSVSANRALRDLGNFGRFWTDPDTFSGTDARMYRPALLTSFALNMAVSPAAWSLKAGNVLLHAAVSVLLFGWLWRLSRRLRAAFVVAALFATHPLLSEAVNLVSARSELLSTFGVLLALFAHVSWQRRCANAWPLLLMLLGCVLACGAKETGVVLPALLLVQSFCLRQRAANAVEWRRAIAGIAPVVVLVLGYLIARKLLLGQATVQLLDRAGDDPASGHGRDLVTQLATMGALLPGVLLQCVVPRGLSFDPIVTFRTSFFELPVLLGWACLLGLTFAAVRRGPGARLRRLGAVFAWAIAMPWIVVPLNMPLAEHRLYGPLVGLAAVALLACNRTRFAWLRRQLSPQALRSLTAVLVLLGIVGATRRSLLYGDERDMWKVELAQNPESFRAWWGLGMARRRNGDLTGAIAPLEQAHRLYPAHFDALRHLVEVLVAVPDDTADPQRSLAAAQLLSERRPRDPWSRTLVAQAHLQAGRVIGGDAGSDHFRAAERVALSCLEVAAAKGYVYQLAAYARHGLGDEDGALQHLDDSIARGLATVGVRIDRARLLSETGRHRAARAAMMQLQREQPTDARVLNALRELATPPR